MEYYHYINTWQTCDFRAILNCQNSDCQYQRFHTHWYIATLASQMCRGSRETVPSSCERPTFVRPCERRERSVSSTVPPIRYLFVVHECTGWWNMMKTRNIGIWPLPNGKQTLVNCLTITGWKFYGGMSIVGLVLNQHNLGGPLCMHLLRECGSTEPIKKMGTSSNLWRIHGHNHQLPSIWI